MKTRIFLILFLFSIKLFGQTNILITEEMEMVINDFQKEINNAEVLLIKYFEKGNEDIFIVTDVVYIETVTDPFPSFVFKYKNAYVCLYTGIEKFICQPKKFKDDVTEKLSLLLEREEVVRPSINKDNKGEEYEIEIGSTFEPYFKEYVFKNKKLISSKEILPTAIDSSAVKDLFDFN